jgi:hypothetical protein
MVLAWLALARVTVATPWLLTATMSLSARCTRHFSTAMIAMQNSTVVMFWASHAKTIAPGEGFVLGSLVAAGWRAVGAYCGHVLPLCPIRMRA